MDGKVWMRSANERDKSLANCKSKSIAVLDWGKNACSGGPEDATLLLRHSGRRHCLLSGPSLARFSVWGKVETSFGRKVSIATGRDGPVTNAVVEAYEAKRPKLKGY